MGLASSMKPVLEVITNECPLKEVAISKMKILFQPWIFRGQAEWLIFDTFLSLDLYHMWCFLFGWGHFTLAFSGNCCRKLGHPQNLWYQYCMWHVSLPYSTKDFFKDEIYNLHTPLKTYMEPENIPLEKEKHRQTTNFWFHVSFWGCIYLKQIKHLHQGIPDSTPSGFESRSWTITWVQSTRIDPNNVRKK